MKNTMTRKIICIVVASAFLINNVAYGLSPMPGSTQPGTKAAMYAFGQKLFGAKRGPGVIDFDSYGSESFIGDELLRHPNVGVYIGEANGYKTKFVETDYDNPPEAWKNNPLLKETDLIGAFKAFRDTEAKIPAENLDIKEGYFPVDEEKGELPVARIEKIGENKYVLVIHTKFVQMWNHIRKNDVWLEANLGPNDRRTLSVAWGIFYRLVKHELTDLKRENLLPKSIGHISSINGEVILNENEITANTIGGNYRLLNDSIWMWFLGAYCFSNTTRYNNEKFLQRINWMFDGIGATELKLDSEFPQLLSDGNNRTLATAFAYAINYNFFNRPDIVVPKTSVNEEFIREYKEREEARKAISIAARCPPALIQISSTFKKGQTPESAKEVTVENLSVTALTEAVIAAIKSDPDTKISVKARYTKLWNKFIKKCATEDMTVNIADVEKTITAKIKNYNDNKISLACATLFCGALSLILLENPRDRWLFLLVGLLGPVFFLVGVWNLEREMLFSRLADYLKKAKEGLETQKVTAVTEKPIYATGQTPEPAKKVTVENIGVDTLTKAVIAAIESDSSIDISRKEEYTKLWNDFIKERATKDMPVNIADVKKTLASKIKDDKYGGIAVSLSIIGAGIGFVLFSASVGWILLIEGLKGLAILITVVILVWYITKEVRFEILAGYLEKAKDGLENSSSQAVSTAEREQTLAATGQTQPESRASSAGEEAVSIPQTIVEEHPLAQLISEYIVRLGLEKGPGTEALLAADLENIYKTVDLLRENSIEIFIPQQVKLTESMQKAIKDMGKKEGGNYIACRQYSDLQNLATLLQSPPAGKRIVITDIAEEKDQEQMARLVAEHPESFSVTRLLNITLPVNYSKMDNTEKTVYQAKIVTIAILARLFEKNKTPMVEMLLKHMIKGCLDVDDKGMNEYFDELGNPNDGQGLSREALVKRILFLIGKTIKVVERIGEEIRLMKAFWTAA